MFWVPFYGDLVQTWTDVDQFQQRSYLGENKLNYQLSTNYVENCDLQFDYNVYMDGQTDMAKTTQQVILSRSVYIKVGLGPIFLVVIKLSTNTLYPYHVVVQGIKMLIFSYTLHQRPGQELNLTPTDCKSATTCTELSNAFFSHRKLFFSFPTNIILNAFSANGSSFATTQ